MHYFCSIKESIIQTLFYTLVMNKQYCISLLYHAIQMHKYLIVKIILFALDILLLYLKEFKILEGSTNLPAKPLYYIT